MRFHSCVQVETAVMELAEALRHCSEKHRNQRPRARPVLTLLRIVVDLRGQRESLEVLVGLRGFDHGIQRATRPCGRFDLEWRGNNQARRLGLVDSQSRKRSPRNFFQHKWKIPLLGQMMQIRKMLLIQPVLAARADLSKEFQRPQAETLADEFTITTRLARR